MLMTTIVTDICPEGLNIKNKKILFPVDMSMKYNCQDLDTKIAENLPIEQMVNNQENKWTHQNVQNSTKISDCEEAFEQKSIDEPRTDFDRSNEDHKVAPKEIKTSYHVQFGVGPCRKIGLPAVHGHKPLDPQISNVANDEAINYIRSMSFERNAKSKNETCENYEFLNQDGNAVHFASNDHTNERPRQAVGVAGNCSVCLASNEYANNICQYCGDGMVVLRNAESENCENNEVANHDGNVHEVKTRAPNSHPDERPRQMVGTVWNCFVCQSSNECINNICQNCGANNEISSEYNSQTSIEPNLIVASSFSTETAMNPFEINHESNNYIKNEDNLIQFWESLVRRNSSITQCIRCALLLDQSHGYFLRLCEHTLCEMCIKTNITYEILVCSNKLPCCERSIELNEIKYFLPKHKYEQYQSHLIDLLESNSHIQRCFNENCSGYHLWENYYEDKVDFRCNKCKLINCLKCRVIHDGLTCIQYSKLTDGGMSVDKETVEMFLTWIREGVAMPCPKCEMLIEKDQGCDWLQCPFCTTEICWATRGYRWGPGGSGDTSGGCKCTKEKKCIDTCNYCH